MVSKWCERILSIHSIRSDVSLTGSEALGTGNCERKRQLSHVLKESDGARKKPDATLRPADLELRLGVQRVPSPQLACRCDVGLIGRTGAQLSLPHLPLIQKVAHRNQSCCT